MLQQKS